MQGVRGRILIGWQLATILGGVSIAAGAIGGCEPAAPVAITEGPTCTSAESGDVYARYVAPILATPEDQSCQQCHEPEINLTVFERESSCHTMACMIESGLVDLDDPESSQILWFIQFGLDEGGMKEEAEREYEGFLQWIRYGAQCQLAACGEMVDPCSAGPVTVPPTTTGSGGSSGSGGSTTTMIGSCTEQDVLTQFDALVVGKLGGCADCHDPAGAFANENDPGWWIDESDSKATLWNMIGEGAMLSALAPTTSELITKPLPEGQSVPSAIGTFTGVNHGGGPKLIPGKPTFAQNFADLVAFVDYYRSCVNN